MFSISKEGAVSLRVCVKLLLVVAILSSGGYSVLPGLLASGSAPADSGVPAGRVALLWPVQIVARERAEIRKVTWTILCQGIVPDQCWRRG
jgi:hypothetical protein